MRNPLTKPTPDAIATDAQADEARQRLAALRGESDRWRTERDRIALDRGEALATGSTASLAEAGRLSARISVGDSDDADRRLTIAALDRRLAAWESGKADRQRDAAETALALAAEVAADAEDRFADAALQLMGALAELEAAGRSLRDATRAAGKLGIARDHRSPASGRALIHSLLSPAAADPEAVVSRWRSRPSRRSTGGPAPRRRFVPPAPATGQAAADAKVYGNFAGMRAGTFTVASRNPDGSPVAS